MSQLSHGSASSPLDKPVHRPLEGRRFIWLLVPPWDNVPTRQQHFAKRLARLGAEIVYVENPTAWSSAFKQGGMRAWPNPRPTNVREVEPGLFVMKPAFHLPGGRRSESVARLNGRMGAAVLRRWLRLRGWVNYDCWCRVPHSVLTLNHLQPAKVVYDITDDYELYEQDSKLRKIVARREVALLAKADIINVTAKELLHKSSLRGRRCHYIPNGVEYGLFAEASEPGPVHPLVAKMKRPVIGYVGLTSHWMDFSLLESMGARWPGQILMLGPVAAQVEARAKAIPGLVWGGFVPQTELAPYLRGIDVFTMPHVKNELRKNANPLKIWEYLATGKPFVSIDVPALEPVRHLVHVSNDPGHFLQLVEEQLAVKDTARPTASQAYAKTQSWDALFSQVLEQLDADGAAESPAAVTTLGAAA